MACDLGCLRRVDLCGVPEGLECGDVAVAQESCEMIGTVEDSSSDVVSGLVMPSSAACAEGMC